MTKLLLKSLLLAFIFFGTSCSKDDDCEQAIDCLPNATEQGANTAGCLVDGQILLPDGESLNSGSDLHYQYLNYEGGYLFSLAISDLTGKHHRTARIVYKGDTKLEMEKTYEFGKESEDGNSGVYLIDAGFVDAFVTTDEINGELTISFLDESQRILSGEFWFDAINSEGEVIEIREGRFDLRF